MNTHKKNFEMNNALPKIGDSYEFEFSLTDEQVRIYAQISGDTNPIHISKEYGINSMFGKCIVHGYFSTSIFSKIYGTKLYSDGHILVSQKCKYIAPIYTDTEYLATFKVKQIFPSKNRVKYLNEIFDKQTGKLKVTGEAVLLNKKYYNW
jgi:3-hydroxybutyryl-CoA dehydratase